MSSERERAGSAVAIGGSPRGERATGPSGRITVKEVRPKNRPSLTKEAVLIKLQSEYLPGLKSCYRELLAVTPTATGAATIDLSIDLVGKSNGTSVTAFDTGMGTCMKSAVESWRFPAPTGQWARVEITLALQPD